ncbi:MAG: MCE family protein, partial [Treponema sp.]|nr:MCE family protein [Treponema sp.]
DIKLSGNEARIKVGFLNSLEIREGSQLTRKSSSLLGTSVLSLEPGPDTKPLIPPGGTINSGLNAADMNALLGNVSDLGTQITSILDEFQKNQMALMSVFLENANSITGQIDSKTGDELDKVSRILDAVALVTERIDTLLKNNEGNINSSMNDIYSALADVQSITDEIRQGKGNIGQAVYSDDLYNNLLAVTESTNQTAIKLTEALGSIDSLAKNTDNLVTNAGVIVDKALGLGIQIDSGVRYDFLSANMRAGASLRLQPASNDRWYRIGVSSVPDGVSHRTVTQTTNGSGSVTLEDTTETNYNYAIDLELARSFGFLTLRGGLYESTAGFGLDITPLQWISLSGELFNFRSGELPNLRSTLTIYPFFNPDSDMPWNWIYINGGINNALTGQRDFFIGGGLRFADREVKGLVGLIPALN